MKRVGLNWLRRYGTGKPFRRPLEWGTEAFYDPVALDREMRRVFDVCHGCRLCFNLCDSFPTLFQLIDEASPTGELDGVPSPAFGAVLDKCTLCDLCSVGKCPYVPPHSHNIDFPQLVVRARAAARPRAKGNRDAGAAVPGANVHDPANCGDATAYADRVRPTVSRDPPPPRRRAAFETLLGDMDRAGPMLSHVAGAANAAAASRPLRRVAERALGLHRDAKLPEWTNEPYVGSARARAVVPDPRGRAGGARVLLYVNCNPQFNKPQWAAAAHRALARLGFDVVPSYEGCCGMPQMEDGDLASVSARAERLAPLFAAAVRDGAAIVSLVPSCALMLRSLWKQLRPHDADVADVSERVMDVCDFIVRAAQRGVVRNEDFVASDATAVVHHSCHGRAMHVGARGRDLLALVPGLRVELVERCSGHGGALGFRTEFYPTARRLARKAEADIGVALEAAPAASSRYLLSDCPLASDHLRSGVPSDCGDHEYSASFSHPVEVFEASLIR